MTLEFTSLENLSSAQQHAVDNDLPVPINWLCNNFTFFELLPVEEFKLLQDIAKKCDLIIPDDETLEEMIVKHDYFQLARINGDCHVWKIFLFYFPEIGGIEGPEKLPEELLQFPELECVEIVSGLIKEDDPVLVRLKAKEVKFKLTHN